MTEAAERLEEAYQHIAVRREEIRSEHRDPALNWDRIWECLADQSLHRKILRVHENGSESLEAVIDGIIDGYCDVMRLVDVEELREHGPRTIRLAGDILITELKRFAARKREPGKSPLRLLLNRIASRWEFISPHFGMTPEDAQRILLVLQDEDFITRVNRLYATSDAPLPAIISEACTGYAAGFARVENGGVREGARLMRIVERILLAEVELERE